MELYILELIGEEDGLPLDLFLGDGEYTLVREHAKKFYSTEAAALYATLLKPVFCYEWRVADEELPRTGN